MARTRVIRPSEPTERQLAFLEEYLLDESNATRAYQKVYPRASARTARIQASRILGRVAIRQRLRKMRAERDRKSQVNRDRVIREIACVAFSDIGDVIEWPDDGCATVRLRPGGPISPEARRAIEKLKVNRVTKGNVTRETIEVKLQPKLLALHQLCRILGLYKDLPAIDVMLGLMPPKLAELVRQVIARGQGADLDAGGQVDVSAGGQGEQLGDLPRLEGGELPTPPPPPPPADDGFPEDL